MEKFLKFKDKQKVKALAGKTHLKPSVSMTYTDDTVLTLAIARWLVDDPTHDKQNLVDLFKHFARRYAPYSFSKDFQKWVKSDCREPYGASTNGSAMRVAPVAWCAMTLNECLKLAKTTAEVTHNSEEGITRNPILNRTLSRPSVMTSTALQTKSVPHTLLRPPVTSAYPSPSSVSSKPNHTKMPSSEPSPWVVTPTPWPA